MAAGLSLARPTRRRRVRLDRKARNADLCIRCRVVLKVADGRSSTEAARTLGCAPSTAARNLARYRRHGETGLLDDHSDNGQREVDADLRAGIVAHVTRNHMCRSMQELLQAVHCCLAARFEPKEVVAHAAWLPCGQIRRRRLESPDRLHA